MSNYARSNRSLLLPCLIASAVTLAMAVALPGVARASTIEFKTSGSTTTLVYTQSVSGSTGRASTKVERTQAGDIIFGDNTAIVEQGGTQICDLAVGPPISPYNAWCPVQSATEMEVVGTSGTDGVRLWAFGAKSGPSVPPRRSLAPPRLTVKGMGGDDTLYFAENTRGVGDFTTEPVDAVFFGGGGNDRIFGGTGNDYLNGGAGDDFLSGFWGNDKIYGQGENDTIQGDDGGDFLHGGTGFDSTDYWESHFFSGVTVTLDGKTNDGNPSIDASADNVQVEKVIGTRANDILSGDANANTLEGGHGADAINGGGARDLLLGGPGAFDWLAGGAGDDQMIGGEGDDLLQGGPGRDEMLDSFGPTRGGGTNYLVGDDDGTQPAVDTIGCSNQWIDHVSANAIDNVFNQPQCASITRRG